jgi:DNA-binding transcriptional LysR family regulator
LWTLDALLEEESVTRAAARLGLSTPATSHALARLREQLDDPLLVRAGRQMVPTERARELRPRVRALLEDARGVFSAREAFDPATSTRRFLLHGSDYVILVLGPSLDRLLRRAAPDVEVQFMPNSPQDADLVRAGEVEVAIGVYRDLHPEIRIRKLFDEELVCLVRERHPSVRKRMSVEQYVALRHVQIAPRGRPGGRVDAVLAQQGLARRVARRVPFFVAGMALVANTDYVLTVPRRLALTHARSFGLRIVGLPLGLDRYTMSQIWHPRQDGDAGHRWFRDMLVEACKATRPGRGS